MWECRPIIVRPNGFKTTPRGARNLIIMSTKYFKITLPTDQGYFGQKCPFNSCGKYFKISDDKVGAVLYCPYCGTEVKEKELYTPEQEKYIQNEAIRVSTEDVVDEMQKMLKRVFKGSNDVKFTSTKINWDSFKTRSIKEQKVDSEINCPDCNTDFQVYGIFGYCPLCRTENIMIYDANLTIIRNEIQSAKDQHRALRHAYDDLVSTFEFTCSSISKKHGLSDINFQNIADSRKHFKNSHLKIDIITSLTDKEYLILRRVFQKRHVSKHNKGIINDKYVRLIPQDRKLLGKKVTLSLEEFEDAAQVLRKVIETLI